MEEKYYYYQWLSPVGKLHLFADNRSLLMISFDKTGPKFKEMVGRARHQKNVIIQNTIKQLEEYFSKKRKAFDLPLHLEGTPFQKKVWMALMTIPYGTTVSYKDQALKVKNPKAVRAVGSANGRNLFPIIIPCHRVIAYDGSLGGYGGGLRIKKILLNLEDNI